MRFFVLHGIIFDCPSLSKQFRLLIRGAQRDILVFSGKRIVVGRTSRLLLLPLFMTITLLRFSSSEIRAAILDTTIFGVSNFFKEAEVTPPPARSPASAEPEAKPDAGFGERAPSSASPLISAPLK